MTKAQKKALVKKAKEAGVTDEKLLAAIVGGMSIEEALKGQKANEELKSGGSSEQGPGQEDLAGKEPGAASGSDSEGATQENKPADDSSKDSKPDADKKEKVWKVNCNLFHNGKEFSKDQAMHQDDKDFAELKELGFLN